MKSQSWLLLAGRVFLMVRIGFLGCAVGSLVGSPDGVASSSEMLTNHQLTSTALVWGQ